MSTWKEFEKQLDDCDIQALARGIESVVLRGILSDFHVAACYVESKTLVIDIGQVVQTEE